MVGSSLITTFKIISFHVKIDPRKTQTPIDGSYNNTNVKNMHLHRDSNPGPWNTVYNNNIRHVIIVFTYHVPVFFYKIFLPAAFTQKNKTPVTLSKLPPSNCIKLEANHHLESVQMVHYDFLKSQ